MTRIFTYYPEDFGELPVEVVHMDLTFSVCDDVTDVSSRLHVRVRDRPVNRLELNVRDLEVVAASCEEAAAGITYDRDRHFLVFSFDAPVGPGTDLHLLTRTRCRPSRTLLEGLYYDETPAGAPPTQITQCQQWGFQRLVPCFDDMTAKCTYTTTIIADERYTNIISNGDVLSGRKPMGDGRSVITYDNTTTPMAPYLFFLGVGTYATFSREFEYPDGRTFALELLAPPGSDPAVARASLEALADGVLWVYLFTGPDQYGHTDLRADLWALCHERDRAKEDGDAGRVSALRADLARKVRKINPGYAYTGTVYREIGMQNSDYGGMENVGNTTITANRIMPYRRMTDRAYEYMIRVKVHEYYHNLNGSEVTGKSPFELWLNEAVTVHVENAHFAFLFGEDYARLQSVVDLVDPETGTFALDAGAASMPIEPDGFNDPNELINGVTYVKAPEFVRMIETVMGREAFARGLDLYHRRFAHGNASRQDWLDAMEEVAGRSFARMAHLWLKQTGYPTVRMVHSYDPTSRTCTLTLDQETPAGMEPWEFPCAIALMDREGREVAGATHQVTGRHEEVVFTGVERPAFVAANRGYSFYGKLIDDATPEERHLRARHDPDMIGRFCAFQNLAEAEMIRLLDDPDAVPSPAFSDLYADLLSDDALMAAVGGDFLTIFESVDDPRYAHRYTALHEARDRLQRDIASRYEEALRLLYLRYAAAPADRSPAAIKARQVKNVVLGLLASLDTPAVHALIREQFERASCTTDRLAAFAAYMDSSAPDRMAVLDIFEEESRADLVSWEMFLAVVAGVTAPDCIDLVRRVEASPSFRIEQSNDQRALYGRFVRNRMVSLETPAGREYLARVLGRLAGINEYNTVSALDVFGALDRMGEEHQAPLVAVLLGVMRSVDPAVRPSVYNTVRRLLDGAPRAVARYVAAFGSAPELDALPHRQVANE
ncbi:M1 family metallopeptidase [Methanofollis sp. UBA420]|jgi:aminopeptidase N|uniref:M1 family metallopeptidase n=1 Tax=Methanofollis sp. UBA420 TaxID=1915514 RepID=UPI00316AC804